MDSITREQTINCDSVLSCSSLLIDNFPRELNALHNQSCTEDEYWLIPRDFGLYELVHGVLRSREISDGQSSVIVGCLNSKFNSRVRAGTHTKFSARPEAKVRLKHQTIRISDYVIGLSETIERER